MRSLPVYSGCTRPSDQITDLFPVDHSRPALARDTGHLQEWDLNPQRGEVSFISSTLRVRTSTPPLRPTGCRAPLRFPSWHVAILSVAALHTLPWHQTILTPILILLLGRLCCCHKKRPLYHFGIRVYIFALFGSLWLKPGSALSIGFVLCAKNEVAPFSGNNSSIQKHLSPLNQI